MRSPQPLVNILTVFGLLGAAPFSQAGSGESVPFLLDTRNYDDSTSLFPVDTRAPELIANTGITDPGGGSVSITMEMLKVTGGGTITFTLVAAPVHGTLFLNGIAQGIGATFTQAQLDAGLLSYQRADGDPLSDTLELATMDDDAGLVEGNLVFSIAGLPRASGSLLLVDTRNYMDAGDNTVHTDNRTYVTEDTVPGSLRQAIANAGAGETVDFDGGLSGGIITLTNGQLLLGRDVIIDASSIVGGVTIDANGAVTNHRVMEITPRNTVTLTRLTLTGGVASGVSPADFGGAIYSFQANLSLNACTLYGNSAQSYGGGIASDGRQNGSAMLSVNSSTFSDNAAGLGGGGIISSSFGGGSAMLSIDSSTFSGNTAGLGGLGGGAICSIGITGSATLSIDSSTLSGNSANSGGGIYSDGRNAGSAAVTLTSSTVSGNSANSGGGFYSYGPGGSAPLTLDNTILAGNTATSGPDLREVGSPTEAATTLLGKNLISDLSGNNGLAPGSALIVDAALLAPLGDYGGPTETMPPLPGSPAIEGAVLLGSTPLTDQRGNPRPTGPLPDIGAVEGGSLLQGMLADTDNDGIPDLLEGPNGPYPHLTVGVDDRGVDTDGDGSSDAEEIANMTDLNDATDLLRILSFTKAAGFTPTNRLFEITWSTFPGLTYALEYDPALEFTPAAALGPYVSAGFTETKTIDFGSNDRQFLRVRRE